MAEDTNPVVQQLHLLLTAYGYNLYNDAARARADDLLLRQRVTDLLGETANRLASMAIQYKADCIPPSTREQPFPPTEVMRPMRQMDALKNRLSTLSSVIRALPVPTSDKTWAKFRTEKLLLHRLLDFDLQLITKAESAHQTVQKATVHEWREADAANIETLLGELEEQIRERQSLLLQVH